MEGYIDTDKIAFSCCCGLAVLAAITYARWHYWWKSGFGRARMAAVAAFAGLTLEQAVRGWAALSYRSTPDRVIDLIRTSSAFLAAAALLYMTCTIIALNIRRTRKPGFVAEAGRLHLKQTPWASDEEIGKLTATWDEMHSNPRLLPLLLRRVRPPSP